MAQKPWQDGYTHNPLSVVINDFADLDRLRPAVADTLRDVEQSFQKISWSPAEAAAVYNSFTGDPRFMVRDRRSLRRFHRKFRAEVGALPRNDNEPVGLILNLLCVIFRGDDRGDDAEPTPATPPGPVAGVVACDDFWRQRLQALVQTMANAVPPRTDAAMDCDETVADFVARAEKTADMNVSDAIAYYQQYVASGEAQAQAAPVTSGAVGSNKYVFGDPEYKGTESDTRSEPMGPEQRVYEPTVIGTAGHPTFLQRHPFNGGAGGGYVSDEDDEREP
jgi:hypothetical protein